jgi:putative ABC transport system ATP-binding protein
MKEATAQQAAPLVELRGVSKSYRRGPETVHALRGVDLSLSAGELVVLLGPSGSGKSTLLYLLYGWETPEQGSLVRDDDGPSPWWQTAIVPQSLGLLDGLSVKENVELPLRLHPGAERSLPLEPLLAHLGIDHLADRLPGEVSVGEQQRTAVARALVLRPRLLLADELTGHQDEGWAKVLLRTLRAAANGGTTSLIATHNEEAIPFADRVVRIRDGRLYL